MPAKSVLQFTCERCPRVWYTEGVEETHDRIVVQVGAVQVIDYSVLCENCRKTVLEHLNSIGKVMKNHSPQRGAKKKGGAATDPPSSNSAATTPAAEAAAAESSSSPAKPPPGSGSSTSAASSSNAGRKSPESPSGSGGLFGSSRLGGS